MPSQPHSLLFSATLVHGPVAGLRVVYPTQPPLSARGACSPPLEGQILTPNRSGLPLTPTRAFSPGSAPRGAHAALLSLNPANICCAPTVSHIRASRHPTSPPPPSPSRPARPVGFVTAAAEAQAPRERPERSRRMAGSDTGLPGGSRGNGGWRPLKRDRSRPTELEMGGGGGSPREGLSPGLRPICLLIPLPWGGVGPEPLVAPSVWEAVGSRPLSPRPGDLHALGSAAASQSGISTPGGAPGPHRSLQGSGFKNVKFAFSGRAEGAGAWRRAAWGWGEGRTAGHRPGACALNEKRPGHSRALHYIPILRLQAPLDGGRKEVLLPFPSPCVSLLRWVCPEVKPQKNKERPLNVGRKNWKRFLNLETQGGVQRQKYRGFPGTTCV